MSRPADARVPYRLHTSSDYAVNQALDRYSDADIDDAEDFDAMTPAQRQAAEARMNRRDRLERQKGRRGARKSRYPGFMESDDDMEDEDLGAGILSKRRTRRQYDERRDIDDLEGVEDVRNARVFSITDILTFRLQEIPLEQLSDIKAKSIVEWIANERVRRSIVRHFRQFLMTYVDDNGASVYGQRIRNLGESMSPLPPLNFSN